MVFLVNFAGVHDQIPQPSTPEEVDVGQVQALQEEVAKLTDTDTRPAPRLIDSLR